MNLPYEVTAAGMLIITLIFYNYKNWLDLRKNRIFRDILLAGSIFLAVDSFVEYLAGLSLQSGNIFYCISDVVKNFRSTDLLSFFAVRSCSCTQNACTVFVAFEIVICHDHRGIYSKGRTFGNGLSGR